MQRLCSANMKSKKKTWMCLILELLLSLSFKVIKTGRRWFVCLYFSSSTAFVFVSSLSLSLILTVHHQVIFDPAGALRCGMPHQTVQLHAVHGPQRVQRVVRGDRPAVRRAIGWLAVEAGVPGDAGKRAGHRATQCSLSVGLAFHQRDRFQRGDGDGCRGEGYEVFFKQCLIKVKTKLSTFQNLSVTLYKAAFFFADKDINETMFVSTKDWSPQGIPTHSFEGNKR